MALFTPRIVGGDRLDLDISEKDLEAFRTAELWSWVTDRKSGLKYRVRRAPCGLGCYCDAFACKEAATT